MAQNMKTKSQIQLYHEDVDLFQVFYDKNVKVFFVDVEGYFLVLIN